MIWNFIVQAIVSLVVSAAATVAATLLQQNKQQDKQRAPGVRGEIALGGDNPLNVILGRYATAGQRVYKGTWGNVGKTPNAFMTDVVVCSFLPVRGFTGFYVNGTRVTLDDTEDGDKGFPVLEYRNGSKDYLWIKPYPNGRTSADPLLMDVFGDDPDWPWLDDMIGRGVAWFHATARVNRKFFPQFPEYLAEIDGIELDDPRAGDPQHDNPIIGVRTLLKSLSYDGEWLYGPQGVNDVHLRDFDAQADKCDALVSEEKRARFGYDLRFDVEPHAAIGELLRACAGRIAEIGGQYRVLAFEPGEPVIAFIDNDIVVSEGQSLEPFPGLEELHNGIAATYPEPNEGYANKEAPPRYSSALEEEDDGRRLVTSTDYKAVPFAHQVQRLMRAGIEEARRFRRHAHTHGPAWWEIEPLDTAAWSSDLNGYDQKRFIVTVMDDLPNGNQVVGFHELDPADYDWEPGFELPFDTAPLAIARPAIQEIVGWQVEGILVTHPNGQRRAEAHLQWDPDVDDVVGVRFQIRIAATGALILDATTEAWDEGEAITANNLASLTEMEARGIYLPGSSRDTEWSDWLPFTTLDARISAAELDALFTAKMRQLDIAFEASLSNAIARRDATIDRMAHSIMGLWSQLDEQGQSQIVQTGARTTRAFEEIVTEREVRASEIAIVTVRLDVPETGLNASATAIDVIETTIILHDDTLSVHGSRITTVEGAIDDPETGLNASATAIDALITDVSLIDGVVSALAGSSTSVFASTAEGDAMAMFRMIAQSAPGGVAARLALQVKTEGGSYDADSAAIFLDVVSGLGGRITFNANHFLFEGGTLHADAIVANTITVGKIVGHSITEPRSAASPAFDSEIFTASFPLVETTIASLSTFVKDAETQSIYAFVAGHFEVIGGIDGDVRVTFRITIGGVEFGSQVSVETDLPQTTPRVVPVNFFGTIVPSAVSNGTKTVALTVEAEPSGNATITIDEDAINFTVHGPRR